MKASIRWTPVAEKGEKKGKVVKGKGKTKGGEGNVLGEPGLEYRTGLFQESGLFNKED